MIEKDFNEEFKRNNINQAIWALQDALSKILQDETVTNKTAAMKESVNQFVEFLDNLEKGDVTMKEDRTQNTGHVQGTAGEDVQKNQQQTGTESQQQQQQSSEPQELVQKLNEVLEKIANLENRLMELEKSHPGRQSEEGRETDVEKDHKGFKGLKII